MIQNKAEDVSNLQTKKYSRVISMQIVSKVLVNSYEEMEQ